jgi:hypothetical protein
MDPLTIAGASASLVSIAARVANVVRASPRLKEDSTLLGPYEEYTVLSEILLESAFMLTRLRGRPPKSAEISLRQCESISLEVLRRLERAAHQPALKRLAPVKLDDTMQRLRTSCAILRSIATE